MAGNKNNYIDKVGKATTIKIIVNHTKHNKHILSWGPEDEELSASMHKVETHIR